MRRLEDLQQGLLASESYGLP